MHTSDALQTSRALYIDLLKRVLLNMIYDDPDQTITMWGRQYKAKDAWEEGGRAWQTPAHTMIGRKRLDNIQVCLEAVLTDDVPGDVIETGVWRGGSTILMRGILKAYGVTDRLVWVADSFEGLPPPDADNFPADKGVDFSGIPELAVSVDKVRDNFSRYGLLDEQVRFLKGFFRDTLPTAQIERLALLRLDGDLYESTMQALTYLYPKVSVGGFVIIDDYGALDACKQAVHDYLESYKVRAQIQQVDWSGIFWQKEE